LRFSSDLIQYRGGVITRSGIKNADNCLSAFRSVCTDVLQIAPQDPYSRITSWQVLQEQQVQRVQQREQLHQQASAQRQEQVREQVREQRLLVSYRKQQHPVPKSWLREVTSAFS
jgi:hypothetical protein